MLFKRFPESKIQVIANLANFSYDPVNYGYLRKSSVINIFLETLRSVDPTLILHSTAGLCNLCNAPEFQPFILQSQSLRDLKTLVSLEKTSCDTKVNILTTFYMILTQNALAKNFVCTPDLVGAVIRLRTSPCKNLGNIATIFVQDYATRVEENTI